MNSYWHKNSSLDSRKYIIQYIQQNHRIYLGIKMKGNDSVEADIRDNKVKEGFLVKRSRHLKQWKERWMVLTKTHFYSFVQKGVYKDPTQTIYLKDIQTLKSYYKNQYDRPYTFRIESPQINFHIYAKTNQQKWAWMTAIQKMTERLIHPQNKSDTYNLIRQTIKMSSAVRQSLQKKQDIRASLNPNSTDNIMKKMKLTYKNKVFDFKISQTSPVNGKTQQIPSQKVEPQVVEKKVQVEVQKIVEKKVQVQKIVQKEKIIEKEVEVEKIVEKKVEVPVEKIVYEQKILYVPEIRQKIVEKIVYKQSSPALKGDQLQIFAKLVEQALNSDSENPKPIIDFIIWILTSKMKQYYEPMLMICLKNPTQRFFAQKFLLMLNDEIEEEKLNSYFKFVLILYENNDEYFYSSDVKVLIDILLRELEFNRSEFNQYLIMLVVKIMTEKKWWIHQNHRKVDLKMIIRQLQASGGPDNQMLASQLLSKF